MKTRLLVSLLLLPLATSHRLAAAFNEASPLFTRLSGTVIVPAELSNHSLVVPVTINGRGPFRMLVDTGASVSLVMPAVAAAVDAREAPAETDPENALNAFGEPVDVRRVLLKTIEIGGVQFEGVLAGVADTFRLVSQGDQKPVDGLLGFSLFSDLMLGLDFPGRRMLMSMHWPEGLPPVRAELVMRQPLEVPLVPLRIQGRDIEVIIDTGSNRGLGLSPSLAGSLEWKAEPRPGHLVQALGDSSREFIGRLAGEVHLDRVTQVHPIADVLEGPPSIGVDFLKTFCVVFDQDHDKIWLCADADDPVPAPTARSLGLSLRADARGWLVAGTIPGSPAEGAGISAGDLVLAIEGEPAGGWSRERIDGWTNTHDRVALRVARTGQIREFVLPVWSLVP